VTSLHFLMFTFWNYYVLKLLRLETITFSDATLCDVNAMLCYVLSQYQKYKQMTKPAVQCTHRRHSFHPRQQLIDQLTDASTH
jgi:hypothetical protein